MFFKTHIIREGRVVDTIVASIPEAWEVFPNDLCVDGSTEGNIGDSYDPATGTFTPPAPPERRVGHAKQPVLLHLRFSDSGHLSGIPVCGGNYA